MGIQVSSSVFEASELIWFKFPGHRFLSEVLLFEKKSRKKTGLTWRSLLNHTATITVDLLIPMLGFY